MNITENQIEFCARQCELQRSGEMSVYRMVKAFNWVNNPHNLFNGIDLEELIYLLAEMIEPRNSKGYRQTLVTFASGKKGLNAELIERAMSNLLNGSQFLSAIDFYREFQLVHPFEAGNGRVGALLFNLLNGTMETPIQPPDIFKEGF